MSENVKPVENPAPCSSDCYLAESIIEELEYQKHMSFDYGKRATMGSLASRLRVFDKKVRIALADSIRRPMGVVPVSAEGLVSDEDLIDAEKRRTGVRVDCTVCLSECERITARKSRCPKCDKAR